MASADDPDAAAADAAAPSPLAEAVGGPLGIAETALPAVAFAAFVATRSGRAEDFFLPGLLLNAAYATGFLVSIAVRRPLVGLIVGQLDGEGSGWREDPARMRVFTQATWVWAALFVLRLVVQLPLYLAGDVVALGVARTAMGVPLFVLGFWLSYRLVRRPAQPDTPGDSGEGRWRSI